MESMDDFTDDMKTEAINHDRFFEKFNLSVWKKLTGSMKKVLIKTRSSDFIEVLNITYWNEMSDELKTELLITIFKKYERDLLRPIKKRMEGHTDYIDYLIYKMENSRDQHRHSIQFYKSLFANLISIDASVSVPVEIEKLRFIIEDSGDKKYLDRINQMVSQYEKAYWNISIPQFQIQQKVLYTPNRNERELIARIMDKTGRNGYLSTALPSIFISSEPPPLFIAHPELEDKSAKENYRGERNEYRIPRNRDRIIPETISIEELLGVYQPKQQQIIIYEKGIKWSKNRYNEKWLFAVVLIHEIGHWITHMLPKQGIPEWATDLYIAGSTDLHEGWAQLITWWIADEIGGEFKRTFEKLNQNQSSPYRVFEQFKRDPIDNVMESLERLRLLPWPARTQDWKDAIGNCLKISKNQFGNPVKAKIINAFLQEK